MMCDSLPLKASRSKSRFVASVGEGALGIHADVEATMKPSTTVLDGDASYLRLSGQLLILLKATDD